MSTVSTETKAAGLIKALVLLVCVGILYFYAFSHTELLKNIMLKKGIGAAAFAMGTAVVVAWLYGAAISKITKHTLEKTLESQRVREE